MAAFLIDASVPKATGEAARTRGHDAVDVRDIGLGTADDAQIAAHAKTNQHILVSADLDFSNIALYPPEDYAGIVVIRAPVRATSQIVVGLFAQFLDEKDVVSNMPGRLAIVETG